MYRTDAELISSSFSKFCSPHSLLFDLVGGGAAHVPCVCLGLAAMPQVHAGFGDVEQNHGGARAQAAAVTHHLQQVALYWLLSPHAVQPPVICT